MLFSKQLFFLYKVLNEVISLLPLIEGHLARWFSAKTDKQHMYALSLCIYVLLDVEVRGHLWCHFSGANLPWILSSYFKFYMCMSVHPPFVCALHMCSACQGQKGVSSPPGPGLTRCTWAAILVLEPDPGSSGRQWMFFITELSLKPSLCVLRRQGFFHSPHPLMVGLANQ